MWVGSMRIVDPSFTIITPNIVFDSMLQNIEQAARTCYASTVSQNPKAFLNGLLQRGHFSVFEHEFISVKLTIDRAISHELVRHRLASYSQESTRYVKYEELEVVKPWWFGECAITRTMRDVLNDSALYTRMQRNWLVAMLEAETAYRDMLDSGATKDMARSVLPNSTATRIIITANLREWRHILSLRTDKHAHPDMRAIMCPLLSELRDRIDVVFDNIGDADANSIMS